ncbi:glycosyltransferase family 2 protein [Clostridium thermarum]|uniref:glycosyltransferase family 2 protein n=1 Tax=Clostridium thermarum TaxID=1716543 RepID=UPI00111FCE35
MQFIKAIFDILGAIFTKGLMTISAYYIILSFFGLIRLKSKKKFEPQKSFALLVAAHNEEMVIKDIVHSLSNLDYPKDLYDIFVIADNCTDNTAKIARNSGAIVYERTNKEKRGKGYALEWMFDKIFKMDKKYDSVVVFDADNLVSKQFLREMNNKLCEGFEVVQGYLDSKNPVDSWITGSYSIAFWTSNRMFQLSRSNLKLSNQLGGTGFCISTKVLKELGWGATCLTEDLEFTCKLVLNGKRVGWAHDAVIYDEKPLTLAQSWWQRKRWMQGFADVASRYFWKLIKRAVTKFDLVSLDCAIYSIQPIIVIIAGIGMIMNAIQKGTQYYEKLSDLSGFFTEFSQSITADFNLITMGVIFVTVMQLIYTPLVLALEKKLSLKVLLYYIVYPIYAITWMPISIMGIIDKDKKEWSHTLHTRSININDLEKAN